MIHTSIGGKCNISMKIYWRFKIIIKDNINIKEYIDAKIGIIYIEMMNKVITGIDD